MNSAAPSAARTHNGFNQLLSVTGAAGGLTSFTYDGNGNQVTRTDATGTTTYSYNLDNRLVGVAAPGGVSTFEYDANGLRTKKSDSTGTRSYLLDGLSVIAEYAPDASRLAWYTQSLARIDEVLSVVNGQGKYWYETDALGSTYAMTNAAGVVASRSSYDVFGERAIVSANDVVQPFGFTGREQDPGGLVYARARYLNSVHGQWTQADPLGFVDGPNRYQYVKDQPTRFTDPRGQFAQALATAAWVMFFAQLIVFSSTAALYGILALAGENVQSELDQLADVLAGMALAMWATVGVAVALGGAPALPWLTAILWQYTTTLVAGYALWCALGAITSVLNGQGIRRQTVVCIRNLIHFYQRGRNVMELFKPLTCD